MTNIVDGSKFAWFRSSRKREVYILVRYGTSWIQGLFAQSLVSFTRHDMKFKTAQHPKLAAQRQSDRQVSRHLCLILTQRKKKSPKDRHRRIIAYSRPRIGNASRMRLLAANAVSAKQIVMNWVLRYLQYVRHRIERWAMLHWWMLGSRDDARDTAAGLTLFQSTTALRFSPTEGGDEAYACLVKIFIIILLQIGYLRFEMGSRSSDCRNETWNRLDHSFAYLSPFGEKMQGPYRLELVLTCPRRIASSNQYWWLDSCSNNIRYTAVSVLTQRMSLR